MPEFHKKVDESWKNSARQEREQAVAKVADQKAGSDEESDRIFLSFISSLIAQAQAALGLVENPMTRRREHDPEQARYMIDVLRVVNQKTTGNQTAQEEEIFKKVLPDLQMLYVQMTGGAPGGPAPGGPAGPAPGGPAPAPGGGGGGGGFGGGD